VSDPSSRRRHLGRIALAPLVAALVWAAFPSTAALPPLLEVGRVADADVIAPIRVVVLKDEVARAREAENLAATVKPIVTLHPEAGQQAVRAADRFFAALDSALAAGARPADAARAAGVPLEASEAEALARAGDRGALRAAVLRTLGRVAEGYLAPGVSPSDLGRAIVLRAGSSDREVPVESVRTFSDLLVRGAALLPGGRGGARRRPRARSRGCSASSTGPRWSTSARPPSAGATPCAAPWTPSRPWCSPGRRSSARTKS